LKEVNSTHIYIYIYIYQPIPVVTVTKFLPLSSADRGSWEIWKSGWFWWWCYCHGQ